MADGGFSAEEKAAMKERAKEVRAKRVVQEKIAAMADADQAARAFHTLVAEVAPDLSAKTWYGMQAYARGGKVVCFFQDAGTFTSPYSTTGFQDPAHLDDGDMWPTTVAVLRWTDEVRERLAALLRAA